MTATKKVHNPNQKTEHSKTYLTIINYVGGQFDSSLKSTVVLNSNQFLFAFSEEDKGFTFKDYRTRYSTDFTFDKIRKALGLPEDTDADTVIDALYTLEDYGFEDTESGLGVHKFVQRLTGQRDFASNKVDPRGVVFK